MTPYSEPEVSFLILDYNKPYETRILIESIKKHVKFDYKIIYLHNGISDYAWNFMREGLVDQLICTKKNNGLGIGTRDLFAASFSKYSIYVQNDQWLGRDFTKEELDGIILLFKKEVNGKHIHSVGLAGAPCGLHQYSERAHIIQTDSYKWLEENLGSDHDPWCTTEWFGTRGLPFGGAGPYHSFPWREGWMQTFYEKNQLMMYTYQKPLFGDMGIYATRENPDGSLWVHRTDNKKLWNIVKPTEKNPSYPKLRDEEWDLAIGSGWPDGKIPANENNEKDSFVCWPKTSAEDAKYVTNLRQQYFQQ